MGYWEIYGLAGLVILGLMVALWLFSLAIRNSSIVDIFWGAGFVVTAWVAFVLTPDGSPVRKWLLCLLVTIWGLRLTLHILVRNAGKAEDFRYAAWRQQHGDRWWWRSFFQVFLLQGILMWIVSGPVLAAQLPSSPDRLTAVDILGVGVWIVGFFFEAVGDWQLTRFKADPANKGRLLTTGVWRYTRHPNYFGDAAQWWGFYLIAAAAGGGWTIFSPILMTFLLVRVSGVAMLEKTLATSKPGYREYVERTPAFIPWFPRTLPPKSERLEGGHQ
jgi:steroid 5-alpha reductase family enzyme